MVDDQPARSGTNRRAVLQGIGAGTLVPLVTAGVGTARRSIGDFDVHVEPWDEAEGQRRTDIDTDEEFDAKIEVSGLDAPTNVAYMIAPFNSTDKFGDDDRVHAQNRELSSSSESIIHSSFDPSGLLYEWTEGEYRLFTVVVDGNRESFGGAISDAFRIA